jgi:hypothetical protein
MARRDESLHRTAQRVTDLIKDFDNCCDTFDRANLFAGPCLYFHFKTLSLLRQHNSVADAIRDDAFLESLYATLTAWGLHRMGPRGAKLRDFTVMAESIKEVADRITMLSRFALFHLNADEIPSVAENIWAVIASLKIGFGETKIVAGSKALHHILPDLIPPIDRQYTIRFFLNNKSLYQGDKSAFLEMFPYFHQIAIQRRAQIERRVGTGMNTSPTKVIDNAIVGFVQSRLRRIDGLQSPIATE